MNILRQFSIKSPLTLPFRSHSGSSQGKRLGFLSFPFKAPLTTATLITGGFVYCEYQDYKKKMEDKLEPVTNVLERLGIKKPKITEKSSLEKTLNSFDCTKIEPLIKTFLSYTIQNVLELANTAHGKLLQELKVIKKDLEDEINTSNSKTISEPEKRK
ncbi:MAG: hypothetical protein JSS09_06110 [Verrucomicrobia bacterium]|nr:hypothetical protein [Verrucomicrobiota bacterium]